MRERRREGRRRGAWRRGGTGEKGGEAGKKYGWSSSDVHGCLTVLERRSPDVMHHQASAGAVFWPLGGGMVRHFSQGHGDAHPCIPQVCMWCGGGSGVVVLVVLLVWGGVGWCVCVCACVLRANCSGSWFSRRFLCRRNVLFIPCWWCFSSATPLSMFDTHTRAEKWDSQGFTSACRHLYSVTLCPDRLDPLCRSYVFLGWGEPGHPSVLTGGGHMTNIYPGLSPLAYLTLWIELATSVFYCVQHKQCTCGGGHSSSWQLLIFSQCRLRLHRLHRVQFVVSPPMTSNLPRRSTLRTRLLMRRRQALSWERRWG